MDLSKPSLDVGTMVNDWEAAERFWSQTVGIPYEKFEKLGGGVRQHRFGVNGTVVKVNHSRDPVASSPTIHRGMRIALAGCTAPRLLHDPEGVAIEVVPPGHEGVTGIEVINASADPAAAERFWVDGLGATVLEPGRFRIGTSIVRIVHEPDLVRPTTRSAAGFRYLTVQVRQVDREYERLMEMGFEGDLRPVSMGTTARISMVRDPDGGWVEVSQRAEFTGEPIPPNEH